MKKFLSLLLVLTLLLTCVACGKTDSTDSTTTSTTTQDSSTNSTNNETDEEETTTKKSSKEDSTTIKEEITTKPSGNETTTKKDTTTTTEKPTETTTKKSLFPNWPFGGSDKTTTTTKPIVTETTTKKTNTKPTTNTTTTTTTTTKPATLTTAEILDLVNTTTAKAAKGSYKLTRTGYFTKDVDLGSATTVLNSVINAIDPNASINSVIGGFLGIGTKTCNVKKGSGDIDYKYLMKAMSLTSSDITSVTASGNKYTIKIKNCSNPSSDSPLASATNDYTTVNEINSSIKDFGIGNMISVSSGQFNYTSIVINATIDDGVLTALDYSYLLDFRIDLKISGAGAIGTGGAKITNKYTNIQY